MSSERHLPTPLAELELRPDPHKREVTCGRRTDRETVTIAPDKTIEATLAP